MLLWRNLTLSIPMVLTNFFKLVAWVFFLECPPFIFIFIFSSLLCSTTSWTTLFLTLSWNIYLNRKSMLKSYNNIKYHLMSTCRLYRVYYHHYIVLFLVMMKHKWYGPWYHNVIISVIFKTWTSWMKLRSVDLKTSLKGLATPLD